MVTPDIFLFMLKLFDFLKKVDDFLPPSYELAEVRSCKDKNSPTGKLYYIEFKYYDDASKSLKPRQIRISPVKYPTSKAAKAFARPLIMEINRKLVEGFFKPHGSGYQKTIMVAEAIEEYMKFASITFRAVKDYRLMFGKDGLLTKYATKYWKGWTLRQIGKRDVLEMLDRLQLERNWGNATRNGRMYRISGLFEFFKDREYIKDNPVRGIKKLKISTNHYRPFVGNQIILMKDALRQTKPHLYLYISFMYYTIARPNELLASRISHIDLVNNKFFIPNSESKNMAGSYVDIPPKLKELILEFNLLNYPSYYYVFGKGITEPNEIGTSYNLVREEHHKYLCRFGLEKTHKLYSWKVTGFCEFFRQKKDIKALCKQARHHDLNTTDIYLSYYDLYHHDLVDFD